MAILLHTEAKVSVFFLLSVCIPYPLECNPGVLLIFWVFRPRTVVYFGEKSAKITVFLADFSPKMTKVRPKYVAWGCIQDGVVFTRIRYSNLSGYFDQEKMAPKIILLEMPLIQVEGFLNLK